MQKYASSHHGCIILLALAKKISFFWSCFGISELLNNFLTLGSRGSPDN